MRSVESILRKKSDLQFILQMETEKPVYGLSFVRGLRTAIDTLDWVLRDDPQEPEQDEAAVYVNPDNKQAIIVAMRRLAVQSDDDHERENQQDTRFE